MGQCLSVLSRGRRQSKIQTFKVKKLENWKRKKDRSFLKEKGEEPKLRAEENCHQNIEGDIEVNSFLSVSEESFILDKPGDQDKMNIQKDTKEDTAKRNKENETDDSKNNAVKMEVESQDRNPPIAASGKSSSTNNNSCRVILVKSAKEENFFASCNNIASSAQKPKPNQLPPLKIQKTTSVYPYQEYEKVKVVKKERDVEKLECCPCNSVGLSSGSEISKEVPKITDNKKFVMSVEKEDEHKSDDKIKAKQLEQEYLLGLINHEQDLETKTKKQNSESNVPMCGISDEDRWLAVDAKQKMLATNEGADRKTKLKSSKVSSTCGNSSSERSTNNKHAGENAPYWALPDIPSTFLNKQLCLTYKADKVNVETEVEMKNIDSEMAALLKPDEKTMKTSITFTICREREKGRPQTPQRLAIKQRTEVDQEKIHEKQKNAERRRNENIAKRIQSARRRSKPKDVPDRGNKSNNTMERMGAAIARRDEILNQRALAAQKSSQLKTDVIVQSREMETAKVKEQVLEKIGAATARRHDIIEQRVHTAVKSNKLRKDTEKDREIEMERTKKLVFEKMEEATVRRNTIINQRVETVRKCSANIDDIAKERQVKMAEKQQQDLQKKLKKTQDNRDRILRKKVRRQVELEKRRELARRNVRD